MSETRELAARRTRRPAALAAFALVLGILGLTLPASPAHAAAGYYMLTTDQRLTAGQELVSLSGNLHLIMQDDGNLVLYAPGGFARWNSETSGHPGAWAVLNGDGNFVVNGPDNLPLWDAFSHNGKPGATFLQIQDDGVLVSYTPDLVPTWYSSTHYFPSQLGADGVLTIGQSLQSPDGRFTLNFEADGNVVFRGSDGGAIWSTGTGGTGADRLIAQGDGNLVVYAPSGYVWASGTSGATGGFFVLQNDGNVVFYTPWSAPIWYPAIATNLVSGGAASSPPRTPAQLAIKFAYDQIGKPYVLGGIGPDAFDCSGLTMKAWAAAGVSLPRTAALQSSAPTRVAYSQRQPGDLVFWYSNGKISHVAIYLGSDQIIDAPHTGGYVSSRPVWTAGLQTFVVRPG